MGISNREVEPDSFLGIARDHIHLPLAASTNGLSSATDGGSAAAASIASAAVGDTIFRSAAGKKPLSLCARRLAITKTDASGVTLKVTVRIPGRRWGVYFTEDVVLEAAGTETVHTERMYDELAGDPEIIHIEGNAASDTLAIGWDAKWVGLRQPIREVTCIRTVDRQVNGTRDTSPKNSDDVTAAMVKVADGGLDLSTLYSADMAATHTYDIEYLVGGDRAGRKNFKRSGLKYG